MRTRLSSLATPEVSCAKNPRGPSEHRHMTCGRGSDTQVAKASLIMSTLIASHIKGPRGHCTEFCQGCGADHLSLSLIPSLSRRAALLLLSHHLRNAAFE